MFKVIGYDPSGIPRVWAFDDYDQTATGFAREEADFDEETGKRVGWLPVGDGPDDRYFREAFERGGRPPKDGTFELVGPKVQGNPEGWAWHELVRHGMLQPVEDPPRTFDGLRDWLAEHNHEGLVWHHPDGRMAKIKARDFGIKRKPKAESRIGDPARRSATSRAVKVTGRRRISCDVSGLSAR